MVPFFPCLLILASIVVNSGAEILLEDSDAELILYRKDGYTTAILGIDCSAGIYFPNHETYTCACLTGVWAFYRRWCSQPISIVAGQDFCFNLKNEEVNQVTLLSSTNTTFGSTIVRMTAGKEQMLEKHDDEADVHWDAATSSFVTIGDSSWELETAQGKSYCLKHAGSSKVCYYAPFDSRSIRRIRRGCEPGQTQVVHPERCASVQDKSEGKVSCDREPNEPRMDAESEYFSQKYQRLIYEETRSHRVKREEPTQTPEEKAAAAEAAKLAAEKAEADRLAAEKADADKLAGKGGTGTGESGTGGTGTGTPADQAANDAKATEDEDYVDPAQSTVKNNPVILDQLKNYLDGNINDITGASAFTTDNRFPVFELLDLAAKVMASTCAIVSPDHFKMAVNSFINIQTHALQVKEPYIAEPSFKRIKEALSECLLTASAYNFVYDEVAPADPAHPKPPVICEGEIPPNATHSIMKDDAVMNISLSTGNVGTGFEPIIETVWKTFLNTHNYCFKKFSEYYNDHHTFTVALLHFFTNDIQGMWYPATMNGTFEEPAAGGLLYGGLIGDHKYLIPNIDLCVAASRIGSPYPWLMSRPPKDDSNKWSRRRRKRSTMVSHGQVCLTSPTDIYRKVNHPVCH